MRDFLVSFMGPIFGVIFDFYAAHSLIFNSVVIVYGFVIVLSWNNLMGIRHRLVEALVEQLRGAPEKLAEAKPERLLDEVVIPWEEALSAARFPLVAKQTALYPRRKSLEAVQALLPADTLIKESLDLFSRTNQPSRR